MRESHSLEKGRMFKWSISAMDMKIFPSRRSKTRERERVCLCVCVCVCERERVDAKTKRRKEKKGKEERERGRGEIRLRRNLVYAVLQRQQQKIEAF